MTKSSDDIWGDCCPLAYPACEGCICHYDNSKKCGLFNYEEVSVDNITNAIMNKSIIKFDELAEKNNQLYRKIKLQKLNKILDIINDR